MSFQGQFSSDIILVSILVKTTDSGIFMGSAVGGINVAKPPLSL